MLNNRIGYNPANSPQFGVNTCYKFKKPADFANAVAGLRKEQNISHLINNTLPQDSKYIASVVPSPYQEIHVISNGNLRGLFDSAEKLKKTYKDPLQRQAALVGLAAGYRDCASNVEDCIVTSFVDGEFKRQGPPLPPTPVDSDIQDDDIYDGYPAVPEETDEPGIEGANDQND